MRVFFVFFFLLALSDQHIDLSLVLLGLELLVVAAFSSLVRIWRECSTIHSPPVLFVCVCVCVKWRLTRTHEFHSLGQDQPTVAQPAETTVAECSLTCCV